MAARDPRFASPAAVSKVELLRAAAENRTEPLIRFLNEGGGLDEARNDERQTLLHVAAMEGAEDCVAVLLQSPKVLRKVGSRDRASRTALHLAAAMGYEGCAQRLVEAGAALDMQDEKGCTPLHLAVKFEWPGTARVLLDAGADPLLEDAHGFNAVDMANHKGDEDAASLIASFARRRQPSMVGQLKRCLLPTFFFGGGGRQHAAPPSLDLSSPRGSMPPPSMLGSERLPAPSPEREALSPRYAGSSQEAAAQAAGGHARQDLWQEGAPPDRPPAAASPAGLAAPPAAAAAGSVPARQEAQAAGEQPEPHQEEIEWQGLEPVIVQRGPPPGGGAAPIAEAAAAAPAGPSPLAAALEAGESAAAAARAAAGRGAPQGSDELSEPEPQTRDPRDPPSPSSVVGVAEAQPSSESEATEEEEFAIFRLHAFFEEGVKRLEFEVEWKEGQPSVGAVKPKGEASRRGVLPGDRLVEIAGAKTTGRGREELLPLLKTRPLLLKVDREERVMDPQEPHLELELGLRGEEGEDVGLEVNFRGQLPVATSVQPGSVAWRSGVLEGDGLFRVDGRDATKESRGALQTAVNARPQTLTVWRRPQGVELAAPWRIRASAAGGS